MSNRSHLRALLVAAAALLLFAAPASAGGWRKHERHFAKHHYGHHGRGCDHVVVYRGPRVVRHAYGYPVYVQAPDTYYCGPCNHYFDSYQGLSAHVHQHHGIAVVQLPTVLFQASIGAGVGWAFGY